MVDKVDKPDRPPNPYRVESSTGTKQDKPHDQQNQQDLATFQHQKKSIFSEKFQSENVHLRSLKIPFTEIQELKFRRAMPWHGIPTAEADLVKKDGTQVAQSLFILKNWQDFMKIRSLRPGSVVPEAFWKTNEPHLEVTIRVSSGSGSWNTRQMEEAPPAVVDSNKKTPEQKTILYFGIGAGILILIFLIIVLSL
ncbi:MAG: hypothetical protein Q7S68_02855 [Deltaproteobacteria bacterium]|nr:hypothetical protein [Deltaproteobacteria bacterium]